MELESYNILPVILNDLAQLQHKSLGGEEQSSSHLQQEPLSRTTSNTGAVLLLRCSDEAFDVVLRSLDGHAQELQLAVILLQRQADLEEQIQGSLSHLSQLFQHLANVPKYLATIDQVVASQQRLASVRSRLIRCISKQIAAVSDGQIEPSLEPLINRVLHYPDLSHQYVCSDDELLFFDALRPEDNPLQKPMDMQLVVDASAQLGQLSSTGAVHDGRTFGVGSAVPLRRSLPDVRDVPGRLSPLLEQIVERTSQCSIDEKCEKEDGTPETVFRPLTAGEQPPDPPIRGSSFAVLRSLSRTLSSSGSLSRSPSPPT